MAVVQTHPAYGDSMQRSWYRRTTVLLLTASLIALIAWVSGVFDAPMLTRSAEHAVNKQTAPELVREATQAIPIPPQPVGNDSSVSPVPLPLILTGTMPGRNSREGQAFIGVDQASPQTYAAGALLANGARIAEIYTDRVVLERGGQRVNLYLHGTGKSSDARELSALLTVGGTAAPPPARITNREVLTDYIRPSPVYDGQILTGYQVHPGQNAGVFSQMGLQAGDIITAINGVPLSEPHTAIEQLKQLSQGYAMTATVKRQNNIETLSLDGGLIVRDQQRLQSPADQGGSMMPPM